MSLPPDRRPDAAYPERRSTVYVALGLWHTLACLAFALAPLLERGAPWYLVLANAAGMAMSPPLLAIFVAPVALFLMRLRRAHRRREPLFDEEFLEEPPRGLRIGHWLLGLGSAAWLTTIIVAIVQRWPQGIGIGIGVAVFLSGIGILCVELSERRWRGQRSRRLSSTVRARGDSR